jgi:hypothetical protein
MKRYNDLLNRYNGSETVITVSETVQRVRGRRVNEYGYNEFFSKKTDRPFSNPYPYTCLPAYTRARVRIPRVPGTDTRVRIIPGGF